MSFQKSGTLSYAIVLVGQLLVVLSMVEFSWCSNCRISLGSDSRIQTAYSTITLKRSSLNQLQTIVTPECLQTNSSPRYDTFAISRTVNLTFTIKYGSNVDCANSYLFISGDVTGTGLVTIYEGLTRELSTQHQFSHLVGNSCTDVTIQFYDRQLLIYQGPTIQLYFARPSFPTVCDDVSRSCLVNHASHQSVCLPAEWKCNGIRDCQNGTDESDCSDNCNTCTQLSLYEKCSSQNFCKCAEFDNRIGQSAVISKCNGVALTTKFGKSGSVHSVVDSWPQIFPLNRTYLLQYLDADVTFTIKFNEMTRDDRDAISLHYMQSNVNLKWMNVGDSKKATLKKGSIATLTFIVRSPYSVYNFTFTDDINYVVGASTCDSNSVYTRRCWHNNLCYTAAQYCDDHMDCPNGKDELGCGTERGNVCRKEEIMCVGEQDVKQTTCFRPDQRCDGSKQCNNGYDEEGCDSTLCGTHNGTYLCSDGLCIFEKWVCDKSGDCPDGADEEKCEGTSLKVITASVIGSLMCAIMIVIAVGCTCKLHTNRMYESLYQRSRYESPLSRITNALLNRAAPPPYAEAMQRSRPFEEVQSEYLAALARQRDEERLGDSGEVMEEQHSIASASGALDTTDSSLIEMAEDNSVSYRRNPNKPLESAQLPDLPLVLLDQPTPAVLEPKSDEEEGGSDDAPITTNLSFNENDDNSSPSRRQMIRHNSGDSDVSLLSRSSDDVPLLT